MQQAKLVTTIEINDKKEVVVAFEHNLESLYYARQSADETLKLTSVVISHPSFIDQELVEKVVQTMADVFLEYYHALAREHKISYNLGDDDLEEYVDE